MSLKFASIDLTVKKAIQLASLASVGALAACGGGGGGGTPTPALTYTIGGTVSGVTASGLAVLNNAVNPTSVASGATSFTFSTAVTSGATYNVTIGTNPTGETCTVANGSGTVGSSNVTNVAVTCAAAANTVSVGGSISGLTASGLVIANGSTKQTIASGATTFTFPGLTKSATYSITVATQPTGETCTVSNGSGTASANVTNVSIACVAGTSTATISGTISGLKGTGLVLKDNGTATTSTLNPGATSFTFSTPVTVGTAYAVTVGTQPSTPAQNCTVAGGSGTASANVTSVAVTCRSVGQFLFVANPNDGQTGDVWAYTINATTGALTAVPTASGNPYTAASGPNGVAVDPNGQYVYVSSGSTQSVTPFSLDTTGALTALNGSNTTGVHPLALAVSPSGAYVFTAGYETSGSTPGAVYGFTAMSGILAAGPNSPLQVGIHQLEKIAVDPTSTFLFSTGDSHFLFSEGIGTGGTITSPASNTTDPQSIDNGPIGVAIWPGGTTSGGYVYTANEPGGTISAVKYDSQGNMTQLPGSPYTNTGANTIAVAFEPTGNYLYAANNGDGTVSQYKISATTGALTQLGANANTVSLNGTGVTGTQPIDLKVDPSGQYLYVLNTHDGSITLFKIGSTGLLGTGTGYQTPPGGVALAIY